MQCHGVGLVAHQQGLPFQPMVADVFVQGFLEAAGAGEEKLRFRQPPAHFPGRAQKDPLPLAHGQVKTPDDPKDRFPGMQAQATSGGIRHGTLSGPEFFRVDPGVDDMQAAGIHGARGAVVAFRHGGSRIPVALEKNLSHKAGHGDHGIGPGKKIFVGFGFFQSRRTRSCISRCFGLRLGNVLLNVFEVLKRLKFHKPMLPQAKAL